MKHHLSIAIACLAILAHELAADPAFDPAKTIIIKADDYRGNYNNQQQAWTNFVMSSRNLGIKVGLGVVATHIQGDTTAAQWMQQQQALGDVEFWNHGWDHSQWTTDGTTYYEFKGSGLAFQQTHFADAQGGILAATGRHALAFGTPYNQSDADTMSVMNNTPAVRLFFTYNGTTARSQGLAVRVQTVGIIAEAVTGKPVASDFITKYPNGPAGPVSLQFHPAVFAAADLAEYVQIIQFLQGKQYTFMLPAEYVAAMDGGAPAGARIWTGATDTNWTSTNNWSPSGVPASGDDVAFTGAGANLGTNLNGTARTINSLTFTAGQSAPVTITTTNAAQLSLGPSSGTGPFTVLNVAAGSHQFTGTNGGTGTTADFRFLGTTAATFVLNVAGSAVFDIKGRIVNSGGTASSRIFQKTGTGMLVLSADNGGSGAWQHNTGSGFQIQQGVLRLAALNAGGNSANNYIVSSGAALELDGNFSQTINNGTHTLNGTGIGGTGALRSLNGTKSIAGTGTGGINLATNASIGVDAGNLTIAQVVKGSGSLTKVGAGTLTLTGASTYSGSTTVNQGTLALVGASMVSPITVANGASLAFTLGAPATSSSSVNLANGTVKISGAVDNASSYTLLTASGGITGRPVLDIAIPAYELQVRDGGTKLVLGYVRNYASWAAANAGGQGPDGDFDADGVANGIEFFLNAAPGFTVLPVLDATHTITWTNGGNLPASAYGTRFVVQTSGNLVDWTDVPLAQLTSNTDGPGGSLTHTLNAAESGFGRLKVTPE